MAYDEDLERRVSMLMDDDPAVATKKMFGGLCYLYNGNMAIGIIGDELMVRVGPDNWQAALEETGVREMDFTGRSLKGYVYVSADAISTTAGLRRWVDVGFAFADTLPPKANK